MSTSLEFTHVLDVARDYATVARYHAGGSADAVTLARAEARLQLACAVWARAHIPPVAERGCRGSCVQTPDAPMCGACIAVARQIAAGYARAADALIVAMKRAGGN